MVVEPDDRHETLFLLAVVPPKVVSQSLLPLPSDRGTGKPERCHLDPKVHSDGSNGQLIQRFERSHPTGQSLSYCLLAGVHYHQVPLGNDDQDPRDGHDNTYHREPDRWEEAPIQLL